MKKERRRRQPPRAYQFIAQMDAAFSSPDTPDADRTELLDCFLAFVESGGVALFHPKLRRMAYLLALEALREAGTHGGQTNAGVQLLCNHHRDLIRAVERVVKGGTFAEGRAASPATQKSDARGRKIAELRDELRHVERLPENEAARFEIESEIYRLEREGDAGEWPELIAVGGKA